MDKGKSEKVHDRSEWKRAKRPRERMALDGLENTSAAVAARWHGRDPYSDAGWRATWLMQIARRNQKNRVTG
jgi:hypothetical protein